VTAQQEQRSLTPFGRVLLLAVVKVSPQTQAQVFSLLDKKKAGKRSNGETTSQTNFKRWLHLNQTFANHTSGPKRKKEGRVSLPTTCAVSALPPCAELLSLGVRVERLFPSIMELLFLQ